MSSATHQAAMRGIQDLILSHCGVDLRTGKEPLITARIGAVMRRRNMSSFTDYYEYVVGDQSGSALHEMVDALTTNFTSFFRESAHFDLLRKTILPAIKTRPIRIWSAGCSSGEEPYSIAFHLHDAGLEARAASVLATDISNRVLQKAATGIYSSEDVKELTAEQHRRYFLQGVGAKQGFYRVRPEFQSLVQFRKHNLMQPLAEDVLFDVIFCRNVMIYFNKATQKEVIANFRRKLKPGGYLLIGHSESLNGMDKQLQYVCPASYRAVV